MLFRKLFKVAQGYFVESMPLPWLYLYDSSTSNNTDSMTHVDVADESIWIMEEKFDGVSLSTTPSPIRYLHGMNK